MSAHTPGPWMVFDGGAAKQLIVNEATTIAQTMCGNDRANARLIAAAPELLDVVEALSRAVKDGIVVNSTDEDSCGVLLDFARDALAKATGEPA